MPFLIAPLVAAVLPSAIGGATILGGITVSQLIGSILGTGAMMGLQMLLKPKQKGEVQQAQIAPKDSNPIRYRGYGRMRISGPTVFLDAISGTYSFEAFCHVEGPINAFKKVWFNDTGVDYPPGVSSMFSNVYPWIGHVYVEGHLGGDNQAASSILKANFAEWTDEHQLRGLAYTVLFCYLPLKPWKNFQRVYPNGRPDVAFELELTSDVYDPRSNTRKWTSNPALAIRDFLTNTRVVRDTGGNIVSSWSLLSGERIDNNSFAAYANLCDQAVPLAAGGTEPRYRLDGVYDVASPPIETLRKMLLACDAELVWQPWNGKYGITGGQWEEPVITLTDGDFLDTGEYTQGNGRLSRFNRLTWTFTDRLNKYQQQPGDPWNDTSDQYESGEILTENLDLEWVHSHQQGRRLCKIHMAKSNPKHIIKGAVVKLPALQLIGRRVVHIKLDALDIDETFRVERVVPSGDLSMVTIDLASFENPYGWNPVLEEGRRPAITPEPTPGVVVNPPQGLALTVVRTKLQPNVFAVRIRATADPLSGPLAPYHTLEGEIRPVSGTDDDYVTMATDGDTAVLSDILDDGVQYQVRARWLASEGVSDWAGPIAVTATSDPTAPPSPLIGSFTVTSPSAGNALATWVNPNSTHQVATDLYRGTSTSFSLATKIATIIGGPSATMTYTDSGLAANTYRYWIVAVNGSGVASPETGPITVAVS